MATIYEEVNPTIIPNTKMEKGFINGVHRIYRITPNAGYVLHVKGRGYTDIDPVTGEEVQRLGYTPTFITCGASYAFTPVTVTDENGVSFTGYGAQQYAARLESDVPADQIFGGGGNNDHEIM